MTDSNSRDPAVRQQTQPAWPTHYPPDDEISLFDLWDALVRRWWVVVGITAAVTALAVAYALIQPDVYRYSQVVALGERMTEEGRETFGTPGGSATKLNEIYIPTAVRAWVAEHPDSGWRPRLNASARDDAALVVVEGEAAEERGEAMRTVIADATSALRDNHEQALASARRQIELEIASARDEVESLRADRQRVEGRLERVDEREELLREEIDRLEKALATTRERRQAATNVADGSMQPSVVMNLTNEIQDTRGRLSELRRDLRVELPDQRDQLEARLSEIQREIAARESSVRAAQARLDSLSPTQAVSAPQRSLRQVGTSGRLIASLGLVLGAMLGVFAAFFAEFLAAARRRHEDDPTPG